MSCPVRYRFAQLAVKRADVGFAGVPLAGKNLGDVASRNARRPGDVRLAESLLIHVELKRLRHRRRRNLLLMPCLVPLD